MTTAHVCAQGRTSIILSAALGLMAASISPATAQTVVPQAGANPIVIDQAATTDNLFVLPAGIAERLSTSAVASVGQPKYAWVQGFDAADEYLKWTVSVASDAQYRVSLLIAPGATNQTFQILVDDVPAGSVTLPGNNWDKVSLGTISLPAGQHALTFHRTTMGGSAAIKSIELLRESDAASYNGRIASFAGNVARFSNYDYGVMFQYGPWGFPQSGARKSIDQQAADFNVPAFIDMVKSTGAKYVIWSATWWTYQMDAPIAQLDAIIGNGNRTSSRDLIGEIATALKAQNIGFYLYYHTGQDGHLGYNTTDWWQAQAWPSSFAATGAGNRTTFFNNWINVVSAIGNRYGTLLDGWFFDDGMVYYPAPFEALGAAVKAGNPARLVAYNSWLAPSYTDFQELSFGETCKSNDADVGGNGRYVRGGEKGLFGHCMALMENDWGVHAANTVIGAPNYTIDSAYVSVLSRSSRKAPTSFNMMMYEDGTVSQASLDVLRGLKARFDANAACGFSCVQWNNTNSAITYSTGWGRSAGRSTGDLEGDIHYTNGNGNSATINFTGTAVRLFMPKTANQGDFEVVLDGVSQGIFNAFQTTGYGPRVKTFAASGLTPGAHTVTIIKRSGTSMYLDYVEVDQVVTRINDDNAAIAKTGSWRRSSGRNAGDHLNDVSYVGANGASFSYSFTGNAIQVVMPRGNDQGDVEFAIDGVSQGVISTRSPSYQAQQVILSRKGLGSGTHSLIATKQSGNWMQIDAIDTAGN